MENTKQKSWFGRNWIWVVPVGGCLTLILLIVFGIGALFFGVKKAFEESTPYTYAFEQIENHPVINEVIGDSFNVEGLPQGNVTFSNDDGEFDMKINISGSKGKGTLIIKADKEDGQWTYRDLYFVTQEQDTIQLEKPSSHDF